MRKPLQPTTAAEVARLRSASASQAMLAEIARLNLSIRPFGKGFRICGRGVDLLTSEVAHLSISDLTPLQDFKQSGRFRPS